MMTTFEELQIVMLALGGLGGIVSPVIATLLAIAYRNRNARLNHIDECLDHLKLIVVGTTATRADMDARMLSLRSDIAGDTHGLHDRIFRLESLRLGISP